MVAYDQSVRENAISSPAPTAGAKIKTGSTTESAVFVFFRAPRSFVFGRYEAVIINSATTRVSIAEASAAKRADEKLIRTATFPNGTSDARWASMTQRGTPSGCAIPSPRATTINSPLSVGVTVGASVQL